MKVAFSLVFPTRDPFTKYREMKNVTDIINPLVKNNRFGPFEIAKNGFKIKGMEDLLKKFFE